MRIREKKYQNTLARLMAQKQPLPVLKQASTSWTSLWEIPVEFVREFGEELPDVAVLKVPVGREWFIELKKIDGTVWFHNGWQGFLEHYNISSGYFLVFRYDGNSHFFVIILNESGYEIKYPHNVNPPGVSNLQNIGSKLGSEERKTGVQFSLRKRPATTCDVESTSKTSRLSEDIFCVEHISKPLAERTIRPTTTRRKREGKMLSSKLPEGRTWSVHFYLNCKIKALLSGGWKTFVRENMLEDGDCCVFELLKVEEIEFKVSIFHVVEKVVQPGSYVKARRKEKKMIENKATQEARNFKSGNPFFEVYMYPSYAQGSYMIMRHSFFKRHLTDNLQRVVLQDADGRKWPIRCIINHDNCRFGSGWAKFAKKNNIEEGDVCVFELIN
ncbi:hypothetical protein NE237_016908 [Protea cynaroides]|uniref:TF-B3 domain-containing protein n=1 Tax=Protea cynaroides TaxID=273540 RepID=A0A9Q0K5Y0_9MAGN|nr:hypothetical protein NE237_016908 [Protea cynaroides]